jgi:hypothetical protein
MGRSRAQFRRLRTKLGAPVAIKAMAAKLARLVWGLRYGIKHVEQAAEFYEAQHRKRQIAHLKWKAAKPGFQIIDALQLKDVGIFWGARSSFPDLLETLVVEVMDRVGGVEFSCFASTGWDWRNSADSLEFDLSDWKIPRFSPQPS